MTGYTGGQDQRDYFSSPTNHPSMGSVCHYAGLTRRDVPPYVVLPAYPGYSQGLRRAGPYGGYLGSRYNPLFSTCDPTFDRTVDLSRDFYDPTLRPMGDPVLPSLEASISLDALDRRRSLLEQINQQTQGRPSLGFDERQRQAFDLLMNATTRSAFDLSRESPQIRERYGRDSARYSPGPADSRRSPRRGAPPRQNP